MIIESLMEPLYKEKQREYLQARPLLSFSNIFIIPPCGAVALKPADICGLAGHIASFQDQYETYLLHCL